MIQRADIIGCGVDELEAAKLLAQIEALSGTPEARWREAARCILKPDHPFALHQLLYRAIYGSAGGPVFFPEPADIEHAHMTALRRELGLDSHADLFAWSVAEREAFWQRTVERLGIRFRKPYTQLLDLSQGVEAPKWFVGAKMNIVESCFQAPADQTAIVFQREGGRLERMSFGTLEALCDRVAGGLCALGFAPGDRIAVAMPMTAESVAIYLGIIKAGCAVVAIADSFAAPQIAARLRIGAAKAVFTQDVILRGGRELPLYPRLVAAEAPLAIVLPGRVEGLTEALHPGDLHWDDFLQADAISATVICDPDATTNVLFSSGTTGDPKALPWTHVNPIKVRRRRALSPRRPPRRRGRLADQFGLDDGAVADLRRLFEPGDHGALLRHTDRAGLWGVRASGWHYHARRHSEHGADLAQHGLHGGHRLFGDSSFQYHWRVLQRRGHALSDGAGGVSAHTRILRRHRTSRRLLAQHTSRAGRTRDL